MIVFCSRYFTDCVLRYDSVCRQKSYIEDSYFLTRMLNKHLLRRMNECRMDWVLATTAAFLKKSFHQTGDAFKSHLKCVYRTRHEELPCTISTLWFRDAKSRDARKPWYARSFMRGMRGSAERNLV